MPCLMRMSSHRLHQQVLRMSIRHLRLQVLRTSNHQHHLQVLTSHHQHHLQVLTSCHQSCKGVKTCCCHHRLLQWHVLGIVPQGQQLPWLAFHHHQPHLPLTASALQTQVLQLEVQLDQMQRQRHDLMEAAFYAMKTDTQRLEEKNAMLQQRTAYLWVWAERLRIPCRIFPRSAPGWEAAASVQLPVSSAHSCCRPHCNMSLGQLWFGHVGRVQPGRGVKLRPAVKWKPNMSCKWYFQVYKIFVA